MSAQDTQNLLTEADSLWGLKAYRTAIKKYKQADKKAKSDDVRMQASTSLNKALTNYAEILFNDAKNYPDKSEQNFEVALVYYKKYLKNLIPDAKGYKDSLNVYKMLIADEYFLSGRYQPAGRIYKKLNKQLASDSELAQVTKIKLAQCYVEMLNYSKAGALYKEAYKDKSLLATADELFCQGYYENAARLFSYLKTENSDKNIQTKYSRLIARAYFKAGLEEQALDWYKKCLNEKDTVTGKQVITFNQNCETCDQLLKEEGVYLKQLDAIEELDIDKFYFSQVRLNVSGKMIEARDLINKVTIVYNTCEGFTDPCAIYDKTYSVSELKTSGINQVSSSEYGPMYFSNDSLIFASDRNPLGNKRSEVNGEERSTFDLYVQRMNEDDVFGFHPGEVVNLADTTSQTVKFFSFNRGIYYNEGPLAFYPGTKDKFIFTGNYFTETEALKQNKVYENNRINTLKLFYASKDDTVWQVKSIEFEGKNASLFNSENFSVAHPSFSADGTQLYFSSNAPMPGDGKTKGSYGNTDIYVSTFDPNTGKLGEPANLGAGVNTAGNEMFPYLHTNPDGSQILYYSSNFHDGEGVGQLDIYYSGYCEGEFSQRKNMGEQINSTADDFGLILNKEGTAGYFSSDRKESDDIYKFRELKVYITVLDKETREHILIKDVDLELTPNKEEADAKIVTLDNVIRVYNQFDLDVNYTVTAYPHDSTYFSNETEFETVIGNFDEYGILRATILLEKKPEVKMIIMANVKSEQQVFLAFSKDVKSLTSETPIAGKSDYSILYELAFEDGKNILQNTHNGDVIMLNPDDQLLSKLVSDEMEKKESKEKLIAFFRENNILVPDSIESYNHIVHNPVVIRNIRYGFDSDNFSNEKEEVVPDVQFRNLADVLREYKHLNAKMSSHTDECPHAPKEYDNEALSLRRNNAAVEGLKKYYSDLDTARLVRCHYDGRYPVDVSEENYSKNKFEQLCDNPYNRRTEFKLLYADRNQYLKDCDCKDESMIWHVNKDNTSSNNLPLNERHATQGGR
ncbi:hypothetical protein [Chondrinema litorale]|uniref:hypothetical protein n=1 Tax=Chondrinema litorale TaxID=2994555 RepID=UPI002543E63D|nr:hypothetical protein [Chondrinema litorale]UZR95650.1 hypothetical protein OQ292_07485 [Chondrinema litorale]